MVKIKNGMMSGRVGNLVYYILNGQSYAREWVKGTDPQTWNQLLHRARMRCINLYLKQFTKVLRIGFQWAHPVPGEYNAAMIYNLNNALYQTTQPDDESPSFTVVPHKIVLSQGLLTPPVIFSCIRTGHEIALTWDNQLGHAFNRHSDVLNLVIYTPGQPVLNTNIPGTRAEGSGSIMLPGLYNTPVHLWAFYWNTQKGGKKGKENVSNSVYLNMSSE